MTPNIYEYKNYRDFLKDCYAHFKTSKSGFSYRYLAGKAGLASSGYLYSIIEGERNLPRDCIPNMAGALGLSKKEQQFFDALVAFNHAKTPEAKRYYIELMHNLKKDKIGVPLSDQQYVFMSKWYYPVIREMVLLPHFQESAVWIRSVLKDKVTVREAKEALGTLLQLGLLKRDESGRLVQANAVIVTEDEVKDSAAYTFHQEMLSLAKEVLETAGTDERDLSGVTVAVSKKQFSEIKRRIHEFENMILQYVEDNPDLSETVVHMNVQLFSAIQGGNGGAK